MVADLRAKTGAGMMDCKKALDETGGDMEQAIDLLRKKGLAAAAKKAGRAAKDGLVAVAVAADRARAGIVELNCETDFVARTEQYRTFAAALAEQAMGEAATELGTFAAARFLADPAHTVAEVIAAQIATIGENIRLSRVASLAAGDGMQIGSYLHMGGKIGVLVELSATAGEEVVKDVAMHIAAAEPRFVSRDAVPQSVIDEEREIARAQAQASGKPAPVVEKIADGKVGKFFEQVCLLEQPFVKSPEQTVQAMLAAHGGVVVRRFLRFRLGEGAAAEA
jgi:elongation factor Ts